MVFQHNIIKIIIIIGGPHSPALEPDKEGTHLHFLFICGSFQQLQEKQERMEVKRKKLAVAAALLEGKNADGCVYERAGPYSWREKSLSMF